MDMNTRFFRCLTLQFSLLLLITACGGGGSSDSSSNQDLSPGALLSSSFISNTRGFLGPYSVDSYKIVYSTLDTNKQQINASGLLSIPKKAAGSKSPLLSYQHGTIFTDTKAPSNDSTTIRGISTLAGSGFIVSAPDYLGYAESTAIIQISKLMSSYF